MSHGGQTVDITKEDKKPWSARSKMNFIWNGEPFTPAGLIKVGRALPTKNKKFAVLNEVSQYGIFSECPEADEALTATSCLILAPSIQS